ncbi:Multidrug resistance-associated protein 6 [Plecturocebus cupreus]
MAAPGEPCVGQEVSAPSHRPPLSFSGVDLAADLSGCDTGERRDPPNSWTRKRGDLLQPPNCTGWTSFTKLAPDSPALFKGPPDRPASRGFDPYLRKASGSPKLSYPQRALTSLVWNQTEAEPAATSLLSLCFLRTAGVWVPPMYLWVLGPIYLLFIHHHGRGYLRMSPLFKAKMVPAIPVSLEPGNGGGSRGQAGTWWSPKVDSSYQDVEGTLLIKQSNIREAPEVNSTLDRYHNLAFSKTYHVDSWIHKAYLSLSPQVLGVVLMVLCTSSVAVALWKIQQGKPEAPEFLIHPTVWLTTMSFAVFLIHTERKKGVQSSGVLFGYWLLCVVLPATSAAQQASGGGFQSDPVRHLSTYLCLFLVVAQFVLSCLADQPPFFPKDPQQSVSHQVPTSFLFHFEVSVSPCDRKKKTPPPPPPRPPPPSAGAPPPRRARAAHPPPPPGGGGRRPPARPAGPGPAARRDGPPPPRAPAGTGKPRGHRRPPRPPPPPRRPPPPPPRRTPTPPPPPPRRPAPTPPRRTRPERNRTPGGKKGKTIRAPGGPRATPPPPPGRARPPGAFARRTGGADPPPPRAAGGGARPARGGGGGRHPPGPGRAGPAGAPPAPGRQRRGPAGGAGKKKKNEGRPKPPPPPPKESLSRGGGILPLQSHVLVGFWTVSLYPSWVRDRSRLTALPFHSSNSPASASRYWDYGTHHHAGLERLQEATETKRSLVAWERKLLGRTCFPARKGVDKDPQCSPEKWQNSVHRGSGMRLYQLLPTPGIHSQHENYRSPDTRTKRHTKTTAFERKEGSGMEAPETEPFLRQEGRQWGPLLRAIWQVFHSTFLLGTLSLVISDVFRFTVPKLLSLFLEFIGDPKPPAWKGYLLAVLMFLSACLQTLFEQQSMYRLKVLQMRLRSAITGLVYRKVLALSSGSRKASAVGDVVNLVSVDVQRVTESVLYLNGLWLPLVWIVVCFVYLWQEDGI